MIALISLVIFLIIYRRKSSTPKYFYKTDAQFQIEQAAKYHPEILYDVLTKQYKRGDISKAKYDKAIDALIKDISI